MIEERSSHGFVRSSESWGIVKVLQLQTGTTPVEIAAAECQVTRNFTYQRLGPFRPFHERTVTHRANHRPVKQHRTRLGHPESLSRLWLWEMQRLFDANERPVLRITSECGARLKTNAMVSRLEEESVGGISLRNRMKSFHALKSAEEIEHSRPGRLNCNFLVPSSVDLLASRVIFVEYSRRSSSQPEQLIGTDVNVSRDFYLPHPWSRCGTTMLSLTDLYTSYSVESLYGECLEKTRQCSGFETEEKYAPRCSLIIRLKLIRLGNFLNKV